MPWHARLDLDYRAEAGSTTARFLHQGPLRILQSLYPEGDAVCHNVLVHPPGGLVEGDLLDVRVTAAAGAHGLVTTPGASRFYRSEGAQAAQQVQVTLEPGAPSIIPGRADVLFQFRDVSLARLEEMEAGLRRLVQESNRRERCVTTLSAVGKATPALCDPGMMRALQAAAEALAPGAWQVMPSGAGHDAQYIAQLMPAAMLFVPSIGGISHHWAEDTKEEDLALGVETLVEAGARFLAGSN